MAGITLTEAFRAYGAKPTNVGWSVSAFSATGELVVSLWQNLLHADRARGVLIYRDALSSWRGNAGGAREFATHLQRAAAEKSPVRLIMAVPKGLDNAAKVGQVADESAIEKDFVVREDWVGALTAFDGDQLAFEFRRTAR